MLKATIKIEISGDSTAATQTSSESPTLEMLKSSVIRTMLLELPNLVKYVFDEAAKPKEKPKELESAKPEVKAPVKAKAKPKPKAAEQAGPPVVQAAAPAEPVPVAADPVGVPEQPVKAV